MLSRLFDWRDALVVVRPETLIRWHRAGWRLFWRIKSRPGRPPIPLELRQLIRRMATENPLWGEERIANELLLKLGVRVSPRTVRKYTPRRPPGRPRGDQRWSTFLRNHESAIVACDFFVAVTANFRRLYVFVVIEHGSRRIVRVAVTAHPTAAWTLQQLREVVGFDRAHQYLIHDRDSIFARSLSESHLRSIPRAWADHYNHGRPHVALGPGVPDPPSEVVPSATPLTRHRIGERLGVRARSVLGGLHHQYPPAPALA